MSRRHTPIGVGLVAWVVVACGLGSVTPTPLVPSTVIDTWPIGLPYECHDDGRPGWCAELLRVGLAGLDQRDPGHAPVKSAQLHNEGFAIDPRTGQAVLYTRSGACCSVLVMTLEDGTVRAIGVGAPGIGEPMAIDREMTPEELRAP